MVAFESDLEGLLTDPRTQSDRSSSIAAWDGDWAAAAAALLATVVSAEKSRKLVAVAVMAGGARLGLWEGS